MSVDYHSFTTIETSTAERRRLNVGDWWINAAECRKCGEYVRSKNRHDFVSCSCGAISVDGGSWYLKRSADNLSDVIDKSVRFTHIQDDD